MFARHL